MWLFEFYPGLFLGLWRPLIVFGQGARMISLKGTSSAGWGHVTNGHIKHEKLCWLRGMKGYNLPPYPRHKFLAGVPDTGVFEMFTKSKKLEFIHPVFTLQVCLSPSLPPPPPSLSTQKHTRWEEKWKTILKYQNPTSKGTRKGRIKN